MEAEAHRAVDEGALVGMSAEQVRRTL